MRGHGDEVGHAAYHADLTIGSGVRYVWRGRVTSVVGQAMPAGTASHAGGAAGRVGACARDEHADGAPARGGRRGGASGLAGRLGGVWRGAHPIGSTVTVAREAAKQVLGRLGHAKYGIHRGNAVMRTSALRDGTGVYEFLRSNPHWGGVSCCDTGRGIGEVLTARMLDRLVAVEGACILYTHLGKVDDPARPFSPCAVAGLARLADRYHGGEILVWTTRRALRYAALTSALRWSATRSGASLDLRVTLAPGGGVVDVAFGAEDAAGLTFYVPRVSRCSLTINGVRRGDAVLHPPDHTGRASVSVPIPRLTFPDVGTVGV
ncbi:MAG: hypothetical protein ACE5E6_12965, partial [Phycisphaerae bacterium]